RQNDPRSNTNRTNAKRENDKWKMLQLTFRQRPSINRLIVWLKLRRCLVANCGCIVTRPQTTQILSKLSIPGRNHYRDGALRQGLTFVRLVFRLIVVLVMRDGELFVDSLKKTEQTLTVHFGAVAENLFCRLFCMLLVDADRARRRFECRQPYLLQRHERNCRDP